MPTHKVLILNGMSSAVDADINGLAISFLNPAGGIVGSGDYAVTAPFGNMNVQVAGGRSWIPNTATPLTNMFGTYLDSPVTVTVANNTSGQPRIDYIILYLNLTASPNSIGSNIPQIADAQGSPAGSPVPPTPTQIISGTIGTSWGGIGAGNPYLILAQVGKSPTFIPSGVGSINGTMLTDLRNFTFFTTGQVISVPQYEEFTDQSIAPGSPSAGKTRLFTIGSNLYLKQPTGPIVQIGSSSLVSNGNAGGTPQVDWTQGITQAYTLNANAIFQTFANGVPGEKAILLLKQPTVGGPTTATWPANNITNGVIWPNGVPPTLSTTPGYADVVGFLYDNTISRYRGFYQTGYQL